MRLVVLLGLVALCVACSVTPANIVFPLDGAVMQNPVTLEANRSVTWYVGDKRLGYGTRWRGQLEPGLHRVSIRHEGNEQSIDLSVSEMFSKTQVRTFRGDLTKELQFPLGKYALLWGNTSDEKVNLSEQPDVKRNIEDRHGTLDERLRLNEIELLHLQPAKVPGDSAYFSLKSLPSIGTERKFGMLNLNTYGADEITATLHSVGTNTLVYIENIEDVDVEAIDLIVAAYEDHIYERVTTFFGNFSDVDDNGRVILLFSRRLNEARKAVGYFYGGDLLLRSEENPTSNEAEILYLGVPEDNFNFSISSLAATSCHETQHLINMARKTLPRLENGAPPFETVAMNEGLSHLAEDICGYNRLGGNLAFAARFLQSPHTVSLTANALNGQGDSIERRGAAYLFLRYALEKAGGYSFSSNELKDDGGITFVNALVETEGAGIDNIAQQLGTNRDELLWEWWWALANDSRGTSTYTYAPQIIDPVNNEFHGVDLTAGQVEIAPELSVSLNGIQTSKPQALAPSSFGYELVEGVVTFELPRTATVQVIKLE